jgi:hypothetical protein
MGDCYGRLKGSLAMTDTELSSYAHFLERRLERCVMK